MNKKTNEYDKTHAETIYMEENKDQNLQLGTINKKKQKLQVIYISYWREHDKNLIKIY